ncbi:peptide ABC transporter substrate-binding protein [Allopusillimonas ginsengisoli]|uniref:peptide ABC transporter substrate-binding protein n=1 Tax=Allopusillimonas ginsengisoli TaxID=453575 RepID=UPI00102103BA|nr:peptide ABC transporter substrate-binding protein [Allopusillimonas ginsengisoli]TEA77209.1 peptide ABC transporter substrate-binding protein [Allopusillimonas ginsengisoli]
MKEAHLRDMVAHVRSGGLSRRTFIQRMGALGLAAPIAGQLLSWHGVSMAAPSTPPLPPDAVRGGALRLLFWQGPTLLNPHFAVGTKDQEGSRVFYEPLAGWDPEGRLMPVLAAEVPSVENGGVSPDAKSVTWKLKPGVKWHDGKPFTADDVLFNWQYASDPASATVTIGSYKDAHVEKVDDLTIRVTFDQPTPFWADAFVGVVGMIIPKHHFEHYVGAKSREAPANLKPVGTGPYRYVDFRPGDILKAERNPDYHLPGRPYFDTLEIKGGGDAVSAARAVLQTGEYDYAWNTLVEDVLLKRMEAAGRGVLEITYGGNIEFIQLNPTDPNKEVDGERSSIKTEHPLFSDPAVREAVSILIDRKSIQQHIYGRLGKPVRNFINAPDRFVSPHTSYEYSVEKANDILDQAGWKRGADNVRAKDGKRLSMIFQTSINAPRQKTQAIVKQACREAGIELELKSVNASVYFSADLANPESNTKFYADMQMYTQSMTEPDPQKFMTQFVSWEVASKANGWQGRNVLRWRNEEFDTLFKVAAEETDPVKRAEIYIKMNDLIVGGNNLQPLLHRAVVAARSKKLTPFLSGWDSTLWRLPDWYRTA